MKNIFFYLIAFISGSVNAVFGSGGGILFVSALNRQGLSQKKSQATALSVTVLLSTVSAVYYLCNGYFNLDDAFKYIPLGIPGALAGSLLLAKIPNKALKKIFSAFIIWAGLRMIIK